MVKVDISVHASKQPITFVWLKWPYFGRYENNVLRSFDWNGHILDDTKTMYYVRLTDVAIFWTIRKQCITFVWLKWSHFGRYENNVLRSFDWSGHILDDTKTLYYVRLTEMAIFWTIRIFGRTDNMLFRWQT